MGKTYLRGKRKKGFVAVLLVVTSLFVATADAKEKKRGAELLIQKNDGQKIRGELLAVKEKSLILMDSSSLSGVTVDIGEINIIRVVKKSKLFQGLGYGLLIGGGSGALLGFASGNDKPGWFSLTAGQKAALGALGFGVLAMSVGGIWGSIKGIDESIEMEGRSQEEIKFILKKLNSNSRYPEALPENINMQSLEIQKEALTTAERGIPAQGKIKIEDNLDQKVSPHKFSRVHLSLVPGYFNSQGIGDFRNLIENIGFGDDWFYSGGWFGSGSVEYPEVMKDQHIYFKDIRIEYSIGNNIALGITFSPLGSHRVVGRHVVPNLDYRSWVEVETYLSGYYKGNAYFITASYLPVPDGYLKKSSFKFGGGIGYSKLNIVFSNSDGENYERKDFSKRALCFLALGDYSYFFNKNLSLGLGVDYKYIPVKIHAFQINSYYWYYDRPYPNEIIYGSMRISIPGQKLNFSGLGLGANLGLHF